MGLFPFCRWFEAYWYVTTSCGRLGRGRVVAGVVADVIVAPVVVVVVVETEVDACLVRADLGEDAAVQRLLERALAIDERALAPGHPQLVRALAVLADHHFERGHYAEAEPLYRRLMALREQGKIDESWDSSLAHWAHLLRSTGRAEEAARVEAGASSPPAPPPS